MGRKELPSRLLKILGTDTYNIEGKKCLSPFIHLLFIGSPRLNGCVERANRTHREEFYELEEIELGLNEHNKQLERWEEEWGQVYN